MSSKSVLCEDYFIRKLEEAAEQLKNFSIKNTIDKETQQKFQVEALNFQQNVEVSVFERQKQTNLEEGDCTEQQIFINNQYDDISGKRGKMLDLLKLIPPPPPPPPPPPFMDIFCGASNQQQQQQQLQFGHNISVGKGQTEQMENCEESIYQEAKSFSEAMNQPELLDMLMKYYYSGYSDGVKSKQIS